MMRGRKGQRDTKPTRLHSMNDNPVMDIPASLGHGSYLKRSAAVWIPDMADVSREALLCGFRAEALHYGKHISLHRYSGLRPMGSTVGADTRGDVS